MNSILAITCGARNNAYSTSREFRTQAIVAGRRAGKLKKILNLQTKDTKNYSSKDKTPEIDSDLYDKDPRYGLILLYLAERNWSKALEVKSTLIINSSKQKQKTIVSKLHKAIQYSQQLTMISFNETNQSLKLEYFAYLGLVQGSWAIQNKKWQLAAFALSITRIILEYLEQNSEFHENKSSHLYREILEFQVDTKLKIAINFLKLDNNNSSLMEISKKIVNAYQKSFDVYDDAIEIIKKNDNSYLTTVYSGEESIIEEIEWAGYVAELYNSDLARQIMNIKKKTLRIIENDIGTFDPVILGWQEILEIHDADNKRVDGLETDDESRDRAIVSTFIEYNLNFVKVRRDLSLIKSLIEKNENPNDIIRIFDIILETLQIIKDLPGVSGSELDNDLEVFENYLKSKRYFQISKIYEINHDPRKALLILQTIIDNLEGLPQLTNELPGKVITNEDIKDFSQKIQIHKVKIHVLAQFLQETSNNQINLPIAENISRPVLFKSVKDINIVNYKTIDPVGMKPVFFDLAFNYIGEEFNENVTDSNNNNNNNNNTVVNEDDKPKKKGLFGLWG